MSREPVVGENERPPEHKKEMEKKIDAEETAKDYVYLYKEVRATRNL